MNERCRISEKSNWFEMELMLGKYCINGKWSLAIVGDDFYYDPDDDPLNYNFMDLTYERTDAQSFSSCCIKRYCPKKRWLNEKPHTKKESIDAAEKTKSQ